MTGDQHYREAERLIAAGEQVVREIRAAREMVAAQRERRRDALGKQAMGIWAQAQVHATLALAAATALSPIRDMTQREWPAWVAVAATKQDARADQHEGPTR